MRTTESSLSTAGTAAPTRPVTRETASTVRGKRSMRGTVSVHHAIDRRNHEYQKGVRKS
ncbi:hypothetical protein AALF15_12430 [Corynebacteriaceae bacterium 7-707]|nr:hypothetical protein [Corynebacterium sp.]